MPLTESEAAEQYDRISASYREACRRDIEEFEEYIAMKTIKAKAGREGLPVRGEVRMHPQGHGPVKCMGVIDNWVMCRRPGAIPILVYVKDWARWAVPGEGSEA